MDKLVLKAAKPPKAHRDDDAVDRLSSRYTVMMLIAFALIISFTQWVGEPMKCWVPKHFTKSHTKYANSFCWVNNTYYLPFHRYIPRPHEDGLRHTIYYYQWIPWILLSQAFFFWFPSLFWHSLNSKAGIDSDDILQSAYNLRSTKLEEKREGRLNLLGNQLNRFLSARTDQIAKWKVCGNCCGKCGGNCGCGRRASCYLVAVYLMSNVLYLVNAVCQLFALNGILNTDFQDFGKDYMQFYHGNNTENYGEFMNSVIFPRITMCDFNIRILGNNQRYTVQCCLPLNLYLEKMYLIFWFWLIFLMFFTAADLLIWLLRTIIRGDRVNFVENHLHAGKYIKDDSDEALTEQFVDIYLQQDGAFLLRMIAHNTNSVTTAAVAGKLFSLYKDHLKKDNSSIETETNSTLEMKDLTDVDNVGEKFPLNETEDDPYPTKADPNIYSKDPLPV